MNKRVKKTVFWLKINTSIEIFIYINNGGLEYGEQKESTGRAI